MIQPQLRLVSSQPPEALIIRRLTEVKEAWGALMLAPHLPQAWGAWFSALDRLEAERIRYLQLQRPSLDKSRVGEK